MQEEELKLARHGSRNRYRHNGCRCLACTRQSPDAAPKLTWPYWHLEREVGAAHIAAWFNEDTIARWKREGLGDYEADEVAVHFGLLPHFVFPGWTLAGLDADVYP